MSLSKLSRSGLITGDKSTTTPARLHFFAALGCSSDSTGLVCAGG